MMMRGDDDDDDDDDGGGGPGHRTFYKCITVILLHIKHTH